jgi:hypothetical protein
MNFQIPPKPPLEKGENMDSLMKRRKNPLFNKEG